MDVIVLRHGETAHNNSNIVQGHTDTELNTRGQRQATRLGRRLREHFSPDHLYSSDLSRARQTAVHLECDAPLETEPRLRELDFGDATGQSLAEFQAEHPEYNPRHTDTLHTPYPNGESTADVYTRVVDFLTELPAQHAADDTIVIVAHHTSVRAALVFARGQSLPAIQDIDIQNCEGFHATVHKQAWTVETWPVFANRD